MEFEPAGAQIYQSNATGTTFASETDSYTIPLESGQKVSVQFSPPASGWSGAITFAGPGGILFDSGAISLSTGAPWVIEDLPITTSGDYSFSLQTTDAGSESYDVSLLLNAGLENEAPSDAANDSLSSAESLDSTAISFPGIVGTRLAVKGVLAGTPDYYSFTANAGQPIDVVLASSSIDTKIELVDSLNRTIASGIQNQSNGTVSIRGFAPATSSTVYARVSGVTPADYSVVVARSIAFELEPNDGLASAQEADGRTGVIGAITGVPLITTESEPNDNGLAGGQVTDLALANDLSGSFLPIGNNQYRAVVTGVVSAGSDNGWDFFKILAGPGDTLVVDLEGSPTAAGSLSDPYVHLYNSAGSRLTYDDDAGVGYNSRLTYSFATFGDYYIVADSFSSETGSYRLTATLTTQNPRVGVGSDDYYSVFLSSGSVLELRSATPGTATVNSLDPTLEVYDPSGSLVASDTNGAGDGRNALISYTAAGSGRYVIKVSGGGTRGDYVLSVAGGGVNAEPLQVASITPSNGALLNTLPTSIDITFNQPLLLTSVSAGDLTVNGVQAAGVAVIDGDTLRFDVSNSVSSDGVYTVVIGADAIQSLSGASSEFFLSTFDADANGPVVVASSIADGAVVAPGTISYQVTLNEPINSLNLGVEDLFLTSLSGGGDINPTSLLLSGSGTVVTATFQDVVEGDYRLTLLSGAGSVRDPRGNLLDGGPSWPLPSGGGAGGDNFVIDFVVDATTIAFPTPIDVSRPIGGFVYERSLSARIGSANDSDRYALSVEAGQLVTVAAIPDATLRGIIELRNPEGVVIATGTSGSLGEPALIQSAVADVAGEYSITVSSSDGTIGSYELRALMNTGLETEGITGVSNDTLASAESLATTAVSILAGTSSFAVRGQSSGEDDYFRFFADAGKSLTVTAASIAGSVQVLELYNTAGIRIAVGLLDDEGVSQSIRSVLAPEAGDYYVRIRGLSAAEYGLAVLISSDVDVESNDDLGTPQLLDGPTIVLGGLQIGGGEVAIDFSDSVGSLSLEGFAATGLWHVTDQWSGPAEGHSAPSIAYFGSDATGNFNLGTVSGTLTSPPVALRGGTSPTLSFRYRLQSETGTTWDRALVRVSTNGGQSWETVATKADQLSQSLTWRPVTVDLSSYAGQTVLVQFSFDSGDGISNSGLGWQIDDVSVTGVEDVQDHYAFYANDGDQLIITTTTPGDSEGEPYNALDAKLELFNEAGLLIATDDNSASDGRNPRLEFTVPAGQGGRLTARLSSSTSGSYALSISGTSASNTHAPTVTSVLPQNGQQLAAAPTSLLVTFSEAIRVDSVSASDLVFTDATVSVTGVEFVDGRNVRFSLNIPNADGIYDYSLDAGAVLDLQGLGNAGFSGSFNVDRDGPVVVSSSPSTQASAPFSQISFFFDEAIDPASVSVADVIAFAGPSGNLLSAVTGVEVVINELIVRFQGQVTPGVYTMQIGPNLADLVGNLMNQDQDDANGESSDDRYSVTLNLQSPDLVVQSAQTVSSALFGQTINVEYEVRNIGDDPALEGWFDAVYLSTDAVLDRNDLRLASVPSTGTFGPLDAAGGATDRYTRTAMVTLPLNDSVLGGNYFLIVATDDGARQPEANEANNALATSVVSIATPPSVDLRVTNIVAPVEALSGQTIPIEWTITNSGAADFTGTFRDQVYLSADAAVGGDQFFGNFDFTGTIPAGGSITRIQQITLPLTLADDRYVIIRTDASNSVLELGGENNNTLVDDAIIDVRLSPFPNLQVTDVIAPPSAFSDQSVIVEWIVTNNGNGPTNAPTWTDRVYLSPDQVYDASDTLLGSVNNPAFLAAGDSYRSSLSATLPRGIDDNYYFIVRTDVFNNVNELNNENDNTGVSDVTDVQLTPPPDLRVTTVQAPAASFSGQTVTFNWTVTNEGPGGTRAGAWSDRIYFSADNVLDASDVLLTTVGHSGALDPGASYNASGTGTLPIGVSGNFFFIVQTDAFNNVFEHVFESNNTGFDTSPTAVSLTPPPDLEVELVDAPAAATSSRSLTVNYRVTNFGATETPNANWNDRLFLSTDNVFDAATDLQIATRTHFGVLEPGESYNESFTTTLSNTITGSYFVFVVTDFGNAVFELDNNNNVGFDSTPLAITSQPANLSVASFTGPSAAEAGDSFLLSWVIQNIGVGDTAVASWFDRVVLSSDIVPSADDLVLASVTHNGLLNPGGSYAINDRLVQIPFTIAPGSYFLLLTTDAGNNVFEGAGEGNNVASPRPIVISRDESDLRVASVTASGSAQSGGSLTVNWTVRNDSPVATNANFWFDEVYLSTNNVIDDGDTLLGAVQRSNPLAPQGQYSVSRDFTLPQNVTGQFFVIVRTDSSNLVVEGPFENNNDRAASGNVEVGLSLVPDLAVTNVNAPTDGFGGQPFPLSWTVNNVGQEATNGSWYDSVYLSLDQVFDRATDTYLGFANRPNNLAVGASYTQTQSFNIPAGFAGQYYVFVVADGNDRVFERGSELNNTRLDPVSMHVTLTPPADFVVGSITIPANGVPGQTANFSYTVVNQGVNAAVGSWVDSIYLSADDVWDVNDPLVHRSTRSGPVAGGTSYTESFAAPLPGVVPGDYHIIIRSDILNRIPESNEGNNIGVSLNQAALDFQELELGVAASGELAEGRTAYYKVTVPAGETLSFLLDSSLSNGANEVYVAFERVPTRSNYDFAAIDPFEVDQRALVPSTQAGTYFVAVYAADLFVETQLYEMTAELLDFEVFDTSYGRGGNSGDLTIEINGAKFDRTLTARLVDAEGISHAARQIWYTSEVKAYATFDLRSLRQGQYDVVVENGVGGAVTVDQGLQVVSISPAPSVSVSIDAPATVRRNTTYSFTVRWGNDSLNDAPAPLLAIGSEASIGLSPSDTDSLGTGYIFFAKSEAVPGIIRPGETGSRTFFAYSDNNSGNHFVYVDRLLKNGTQQFNWESLRPQFEADPIPQELANDAFALMRQSIGDTNAEVEAALALASRKVGSFRNVRDLLQPYFEEAVASLTPSVSGSLIASDITTTVAKRQVVLRDTFNGSELGVITRSDGSFSLSQLPAGAYQLVVPGVQLSAPLAPIVIEPASRVRDLRIAIEEGFIAAGTVRKNSTPIEGAVVLLMQGTSFVGAATTNRQGHFELSGLDSGNYVIVVSAEGIATSWTDVVVDAGSSDFNIEVSEGGQFVGRVVNSAQELLDDALIELSLDNERPLNSLYATSDGGSFVVTAVGQGTYRLTVRKEGYSDYIRTNVVMSTNGEIVDIGMIELEPSATVPFGLAAAEMLGPSQFDGPIAIQVPAFPPGLHEEGILAGALYAGGWEAYSLFVPYLYGYGPNSIVPVSASGAEQFRTHPITQTNLGNISGAAYDAALRRLQEQYPDGIPCDHPGISVEYDLASLALNTSWWTDRAAAELLDTRVASPAIKQLWAYPAANADLPGTIAGGVGQWGGYGYGTPGIPPFTGTPGPLFDDVRRVTGTVRVTVLPFRTQATVDIDYRVRIVDAVDFSPGDIYLRGVPIFGLAKWAEEHNYYWDQPFLVDFTDKFTSSASLEMSDDCDPCNNPYQTPLDDCDDIDRPVSRDPNDILGPNGFGPERWITASQPLSYTIRFENDPIFATAPAQVVRITQTLDSDLDFRTFRVGDFAIGTHFVDVPDNRAFYQERLDLRGELGIFVDVFAGIDVTTGEAFWEFTSIDPATGEQPLDALTGFLPPNLTSPEGEGFVTYSVRSRATATTGTVIDAEARIIFDVNEPIDTPPIFNTLDAGLPTSVVTALPTDVEASTFLVSWSGMDADGGSGLAGFDIYVSQNDGPYQLFLANTTLTSAEFVGEPNSRYAFYSVARDNAGNVEAAPATPDATTMTPGPVDATPPSVTGTIVQNGLTQRSYVDRLVIEFSEQVNLAALIGDGGITSAITLTNLGVNAPVDSDQQVMMSAGQFQYEYDEIAGVSRLTWSLDQFAGTNASLPDGLYEFVINASLVTDLAGNPFDGNGDGTAGDNFVLSFHRLSGDANGDRTVDVGDMQLVNAALGSRPDVAAWNANADLDRDGVVTTRDRLTVFRGSGNSIVVPTTGSGLAGDFNNDGSVDAADYTVWRDNYGATGLSPLAGDGDGNGVVDDLDYQLWRLNYGRTSPQELTVAPAVTVATSVEVVLAYARSATEVVAANADSAQLAARGDLVGLAFAADQLSTNGFHRTERASFRSEPRARFEPRAVSIWDVVNVDETSWRAPKADTLSDGFGHLFEGEDERVSSADFDAAFADLFEEADFNFGRFSTRLEHSSRLRGQLAKVE